MLSDFSQTAAGPHVSQNTTGASSSHTAYVSSTVAFPRTVTRLTRIRDVSPLSFHTSHCDSNLPFAFHTGIATPCAMLVTMSVLPPADAQDMDSVPFAFVATDTPWAARTPKAEGVIATGPSTAIHR